MEFKGFLKEVEKKGCVEFVSGTYLCTQEYMIAQQKTWEDEDPGKSFDFTENPFWCITNTGDEPYRAKCEEDKNGF